MKFPRLLLLLTIVLISFCALAAFALVSSWPLERFLAYSVERDYPFIQVESLTIAEHRLGRDGSFDIDELKGRSFVDGAETKVNIKRIRIADVRTLFDPQKETQYQIEGIDVVRDDVALNGGRARLTYKGTKERWRLHGEVFIASVKAAGQSFKETTFGLEANEKELSLKGARLMLPEGAVTGDFTLSMSEFSPYTLTLELSRVPSKFISLESFNMENQLRGLINGRLNLKGDARRIVHIDAQMEAPHGMYMNAQLLGLLLNYIPQSTQKKQIEALIKEGKNIYIDKFKLDIINDNSDLMKTSFDLESVEYNLDVKLGVDINVEGGMMALIKQGLNVIPKEKK
jgi:hypothetical protein